MLSMSARAYRFSSIAVVLLVACFASEAAAQATAGANGGKIDLTGSFDFSNAYMFRGLRQDDTRVIMWPLADAGIDLYSGDGVVKNAALHIGTWNSLNTGSTGLQGPSGKLWYESDFYSTLNLGLGGGFTLGTTYTAYTSPNNSFSTVKELSFRVGTDDRYAPAGVVLNPYGLVAFELDTSPAFGQADGGLKGGTYLEIGVSPGLTDGRLALTFPIKVGLSLANYYELAGVDHTFGYLSLGAIATFPLGGTTSYGAWNVHGGVEFQSLGDTPEAFNGGEQQKIIGSIGIGFSY
jgi:hypothetical protein